MMPVSHTRADSPFPPPFCSACYSTYMSTKTIAVESSVYTRLASLKQESESFTKTIDRPIRTAAATGTGDHIADHVTAFTSLPEADVSTMLRVVSENRTTESWECHDLR